MYTKFSWHSSFDFAYKMYTKACRNVVYILNTFCIHQLHTSCSIFVYKTYTQFPCGAALAITGAIRGISKTKLCNELGLE